MGGVKRRVHFFVLDLPHSDAMFVKVCLAEALCNGHVSTHQFVGSVCVCWMDLWTTSK